MTHVARFGAPALLALLLSACAQTPEDARELDLVLPPPPAEGHLQAFYVSAASTNQFFIDSHSLIIDPGKELRMSLVVHSAGGARTVTYEGLRCATGEYRIYAVGRPDGSWAAADNSSWKRIEESRLNRHRAALASEYLCDGPASIRTPEEGLRAMRDPQHWQHGIGVPR